MDVWVNHRKFPINGWLWHCLKFYSAEFLLSQHLAASGNRWCTYLYTVKLHPAACIWTYSSAPNSKWMLSFCPTKNWCRVVSLCIGLAMMISAEFFTYWLLDTMGKYSLVWFETEYIWEFAFLGFWAFAGETVELAVIWIMLIVEQKELNWFHMPEHRIYPNLSNCRLQQISILEISVKSNR